jgi:VIT1/CCC1 family predicted Fe2+/Mn2+ transporter
MEGEERVGKFSPVRMGVGFGLTSGIITTLGLMVGLEAGTGSRVAVIGGIVTIAIADAMSDALGMHVSQESDDNRTGKEVWRATGATFLAKLVFAATFIVPVWFLELSQAVWISVGWGLLLLGVFSYLVGKRRQGNPWKVVVEHWVIALLVVMVTHWVGRWVGGVV